MVRMISMHAQMRFQLRKALADCRWCDLEFLCRRREAAKFCDAYEYGDLAK
ncbi:hypothetical protein GCM10027419_29750 [Pandoraea terrae]